VLMTISKTGADLHFAARIYPKSRHIRFPHLINHPLQRHLHSELQLQPFRARWITYSWIPRSDSFDCLVDDPGLCFPTEARRTRQIHEIQDIFRNLLFTSSPLGFGADGPISQKLRVSHVPYCRVSVPEATTTTRERMVAIQNEPTRIKTREIEPTITTHSRESWEMSHTCWDEEVPNEVIASTNSVGFHPVSRILPATCTDQM
jgi:hypothetical protein